MRMYLVNLLSSGKSLVYELGWLTVTECRDYLVLLIVYKSLNNMSPYYLQDFFIYISEFHNLVTRQSYFNDLYIPGVRTCYMQKSLQYYGSVLWNRLPSNVRSAPTVETFKQLCKSWLFSQRTELI